MHNTAPAEGTSTDVPSAADNLYTCVNVSPSSALCWHASPKSPNSVRIMAKYVVCNPPTQELLNKQEFPLVVLDSWCFPMHMANNSLISAFTASGPPEMMDISTAIDTHLKQEVKKGTLTFFTVGSNGKEVKIIIPGVGMSETFSTNLIALRTLMSEGYRTVLNEHDGHLITPLGEKVNLRINHEGFWALPTNLSATTLLLAPNLPRERKIYFGLDQISYGMILNTPIKATKTPKGILKY